MNANETIGRAIYMLEVASLYCRENPYNLIKYDDAECDGECVADDCESIAEQLRKELA